MNPIYTPKRSCPRDLGIFYCKACQSKNIDIRTSYDSGYRYLEPMKSYCGSQTYFSDKVCGVTHLGYELCDECKQEKRTHSNHVGQYEIVGYYGI